MPHKGIRITIASIETLIGLSALGGGAAVATGAFGFDEWLPRSWLDGTPFLDYTLPGLVLLVVIGGGMVLAAASIFVAHEWAVLLSMAMGLVMVGFEAVEILVIDRNPAAVVPPTIVQQGLMVALGVVIFSLAAILWQREYRGRQGSARRMHHA